MFLQRSAIAAARRAAVSPIIKRSFASSVVRRMSSTAVSHALPSLELCKSILLTWALRRGPQYRDARYQLCRDEDQEVRRCVSDHMIEEVMLW